MNRESIAWGTQVDEHDEALHAKKVVGIGGALATEATLASLAKTEDSAHVTGDKGVMLMGVRDDGITVFGDNLDYIPLAANYHGALKTVGVSSGGAVTYPATEATQLTLATEAKQNFLVGMSIPAHDHLALTVATTTDTWVYKTGGAAGTTVATVLITYTDSGKGTITTIAKS